MSLEELRKQIKEELGIDDINSGVFAGEWIRNQRGRKSELTVQ